MARATGNSSQNGPLALLGLDVDQQRFYTIRAIQLVLGMEFKSIIGPLT